MKLYPSPSNDWFCAEYYVKKVVNPCKIDFSFKWLALVNRDFVTHSYLYVLRKSDTSLSIKVHTSSSSSDSRDLFFKVRFVNRTLDCYYTNIKFNEPPTTNIILYVYVVQLLHLYMPLPLIIDFKATTLVAVKIPGILDVI